MIGLGMARKFREGSGTDEDDEEGDEHRLLKLILAGRMGRRRRMGKAAMMRDFA